MAKVDGETEVEQPKAEVKTDTPKVKKHRVWPWVLGVVIIIILIPVLVLAFFGFVPGVSNVLGFNKPKDLGVKYTAADYASYQTKTSGQFLDFANAPANPNKPGKKVVFADPKQMDVNLTQEEITATINSVGWLWMPIKNAQVRLGNGTVEVSGNVNAANIPNFVNFIGGVGYPQASVDQASSWAKILGNPPIYIKANASVTNNVLSLTVTEGQVGKFKIPASIAEKVLKTGTINVKNNAVGYDAQSATFKNGQLHFVGTSPTTIYVKK
jgi:hypothetical protein